MHRVIEPTDGRAPDPEETVAETSHRSGLQHEAMRGATWTVIHTAISLPVAFVANLLLARLLGVEDYGRLAFLSVLLSVANGIIDVGMGAALVQFGSRAHAAQRVDEVRRLLSATQGFRLLFVAPFLTVVVLVFADTSLTFVLLAVVFGVWLPAALDGVLFCVAIENKSAAGAKVAIVVNLVLQVVVVGVAYAERSADAVWAARFMTGGLSILAYLVVISPAYRRTVLHPTLPRGFPEGFWRFAVPTGLAGLIGTLALSRTEVFFLTWLSTPEAVGLFALAFGLAGHVFAPADALVGPLMPALSGLHEVDRPALLPAFQRVLRASSTVIGLVCGAALPALALLVPALYGAEYADAAPVLLALGMAGAVLTAGGPVSAFTLARLSARRMLVANTLALVVDVALALALIPLVGLWGAVIANSACALTRLAYLTQAEISALGMSWGGVARSTMPALFSAPLALGLWWAGTASALPSLVTAVLVGVAGMAVLSVAVKVTRTGLTGADRDALLRSLPRPVRRPGGLVLATMTGRREG